MSYQITLIDYAIFVLVIIMYLIIGIYFGCFGSKQKSAKEYMYGRKSLKAIPVGLSIYSSTVSAMTLIGIPQEIYIFGAKFAIHAIGAYLSLIITWNFIVPVFTGGNKKFKSPYEYYECRFNKTVRFAASIIYILNCLSAVPIVLYTCCLPISEATGLDVVICSTIMGIICVSYTMLGGFTTVIWTDVVQAFLMLSTIIYLTIISVIRVGGFQTVWTSAENGGRINLFDFDLNPFKRLSFWSALFGTMFHNAAYQGCSPSILQRYISVGTQKDAKISSFIGTSGFVFNVIVGTIVGLCTYSYYQECDPVANKELNNYNELVPHFAFQTLAIIPGLSGLFISGILSAGLSSMSAELNTISGMIYYDFIKPSNKFKKYKNDIKGAFVMKLLVLIFGIYFIIMVLLVQKIKYIVSIKMSFAGATNGLKLGLAILGSTFPKANANGALAGIIISAIFMIWIVINAIIYNVSSLDELPVSVNNCTTVIDTFVKQDFNYTTVVPPIIELSNDTQPEIFFLFKLSFLYYVLVGTVITICVALIVSYATGGNDFEKMDPTLFIPYVRPKKITRQDEKELENMVQHETSS